MSTFHVGLFLINLSRAFECGGTFDSIENGPHTRRSLLTRSATFGPLRINYKYYNFSLGNSTNEDSMSKILKSSYTFFNSAVKVKQIQGQLLLSGLSSCGSEVVIPYEDQVLGFSNFDYIIYVTSNSLSGQSYVAYSGACAFDSTYGNVYVGRIVINSDNFNQATYENRLAVIIHETTHLLGFSSALMSRWVDSSGVLYTPSSLKTTVNIRGVSKQVLVTPNVLAKTQALYCATAVGMELEDQGDAVTIGSHWEKRIMFNDIMISTVINDVSYSSITLALLKDTGWYDVDYTYANDNSFGKSYGCTFFNTKCLTAGSSNFPDLYCAGTETNTCDYFQLYKASCNVATFTIVLDSNYQYFTNTKKGGSDMYIDYCPYRVGNPNGSCRGNALTTITNSYADEVIGVNSRCFISTLIRTGGPSVASATACYEVQSCGAANVVIKVGTQTVTCPYGTVVSSVTGYSGSITCPASNSMCSGLPCKYQCSMLGKCVNGLCQCNTGYSGDYCNIVCGQYCATCDSSNCITCTGANMAVSGMNCACAAGFTFNAAGVCVSSTLYCDLLCRSCPAAVCLSCAGNSTYVSASNLCVCDAGFYNNGQGSCETCDGLCTACDIYKCTSCVAGASVVNGKCVCDSGFYSISTSCLACPSYCTSCSNSGCFKCSDGYYISSGNNCLRCSSNCTTCESSEGCKSCINGLVLYKTSCLTACPIGYYPSSSTCLTCAIAFCSNCSSTGECFECTSGYSLTTGVCTYTCAANCLKCTSNGICTNCNQSYYLSMGICYSCSSYCKACDSAYECSECQSGYILNNGYCYPNCPANCKFCETASSCTICNPGYFLSSGSCSACNSTCMTCNDYNTCTACKLGYTFKNSLCVVKCPNNCQRCIEGMCVSCDDGYTLKSGVCYVDCPLNCKACDNNGKCLMCNAGYFVSRWNCVSCSDYCYSCESQTKCYACRSGFFVSQGYCLSCGRGCDTCVDAQKCSTCKKGYSLSNGKCS